MREAYLRGKVGRLNWVSNHQAASHQLRSFAFTRSFASDAQAPTGEKARWYVTRKEVAKHNKRDDAWIIIHGKVYDVTEWQIEHPGDEKILLVTPPSHLLSPLAHQTPERRT